MPAYAMLLVVAHFLPLSGTAQATVSGDPLRGLNAVSVIVEDPGDRGAQCNVRSESLTLSASRPLLDGNIRVSSGRTYVYVNANVMTVNTACAAHVEVSVRSPVLGVLDYRSEATKVEAMLWEDGTLLSGPPANFGERINQSVRDMVDQFVTKVKLANQK